MPPALSDYDSDGELLSFSLTTSTAPTCTSSLGVDNKIPPRSRTLIESAGEESGDGDGHKEEQCENNVPLQNLESRGLGASTRPVSRSCSSETFSIERSGIGDYEEDKRDIVESDDDVVHPVTVSSEKSAVGPSGVGKEKEDQEFLVESDDVLIAKRSVSRTKRKASSLKDKDVGGSRKTLKTGSGRRKRSAICDGLDVNNIIPSDDQPVEQSSAPTLPYNTRSKAHGHRPRNELCYDQRYHPLDEYTRPKRAAKMREEHGVDLPDSASDSDAYMHVASDRNRRSTTTESAPTRRSLRPSNRSVLYNTNVHPQDEELEELFKCEQEDEEVKESVEEDIEEHVDDGGFADVEDGAEGYDVEEEGEHDLPCLEEENGEEEVEYQEYEAGEDQEQYDAEEGEYEGQNYAEEEEEYNVQYHEERADDEAQDNEEEEENEREYAESGERGDEGQYDGAAETTHEPRQMEQPLPSREQLAEERPRPGDLSDSEFWEFAHLLLDLQEGGVDSIREESYTSFLAYLRLGTGQFSWEKSWLAELEELEKSGAPGESPWPYQLQKPAFELYLDADDIGKFKERLRNINWKVEFMLEEGHDVDTKENELSRGEGRESRVEIGQRLGTYIDAIWDTPHRSSRRRVLRLRVRTENENSVLYDVGLAWSRYEALQEQFWGAVDVAEREMWRMEDEDEDEDEEQEDEG